MLSPAPRVAAAWPKQIHTKMEKGRSGAERNNNGCTQRNTQTRKQNKAYISTAYHVNGQASILCPDRRIAFKGFYQVLETFRERRGEKARVALCTTSRGKRQRVDTGGKGKGEKLLRPDFLQMHCIGGKKGLVTHPQQRQRHQRRRNIRCRSGWPLSCRRRHACCTRSRSCALGEACPEATATLIFSRSPRRHASRNASFHFSSAAAVEVIPQTDGRASRGSPTALQGGGTEENG